MESIKKFWKWIVGAIAVVIGILLLRPKGNPELQAEKTKNKELENLNKNIRKLESEGKKKVYDKFAENAAEIQKETVELRDQIERKEKERLESIDTAEDATAAIKERLNEID